MVEEMYRIGITAERFDAFKTDEHKWDEKKVSVMRNRTPGAIGCFYSQMAVMKKALELKKHAFVMEDDLIFCSDFKDRMKIVEDFTSNNKWDIIWLGGTYHLEPVWHVKGHPQLPQCNCTLNVDFTQTNNLRIVQTYGCWSTYAYIVNVDSIPKVLRMLEDVIPISMGIDWSFILLEPKLKTFAFVPGMVKQYDNTSDIGTGVTKFSGFALLGSHWWADKM
jgi:GR25 family glycosyltransferase involved in LPS biosynthesis